MSVHEVAAAGFSAGADAYERARPSYPPDAVAWLEASLRLGPDRVLAVPSRGGVAVGGALGYLLDRWLHTGPWLTLILGALGFGGGMREILRRLSREEKDEEKRNDGG